MSLLASPILTAALLVFPGALGVAGGIAGFAVPVAPEGFLVPVPHVGDQGRYVVSRMGLVDGVPSGNGDPSDYAFFQVLPDVPMSLAGAEPIKVNQISYKLASRGTASILYYRPADLELVAVKHEATNQAQAHYDIDYLSPADEYEDILCGLRHLLQGDHVTHEATRLFTRCDYYSVGPNPNKSDTLHIRQVTYSGPRDLGPAYRLVGAETGASPSLAVYATPSRNGAGTYEVWLRSDLPYPIRIIVPALDANGTELKDAVNVFELSNLARGSLPISLAPRDGGPGAPGMGFDIRKPWGPPTPKLGHPFPLEAAYTWASTASGSRLAAFLAHTPDAYLIRASFQEARENGNHTYRWDFVVGTNSERLVVGVVDATRPRYADLVSDSLTRPIDGSAMEHVRYYDNSSREVGPKYLPPVATLPSHVPRIDSVLGLWRLVASNRSQTPANMWGYEVHCGGMVLEGNCTGGADPHVWAGVDRREVDSSRSTDPTVRAVRSYAEVDGRGRLLRVSDDEEVRDPESSSLPSTSRDPPASAASLPALAAPGWAVPTGRAAATSIGIAGVLAALYWLWAAGKAGSLFGLFSRLQRSRALDHPARAEIMLLIEAKPGIHVQEVIRATGRGNGSILHHLRALEQAGLIASASGSGYRCLFPVGRVDRREMAAAALLKSDGARRILESIRRHPGQTPSKVAAELGLTRQTVHYHAQRLLEAGLVRSDGESRLHPHSAALASTGVAVAA